MKQAVIRSGMEALYFSGAHCLLRPVLGGVGAILTLHHVRPPRSDAFQPNRLLEVSPEFLERVIVELRRSGSDIVTLDEMRRRLLERDFARRFVCLTFDDGYRDNREWAYPILKRHGVPFTIYVPTSFPEGKGDLWWLTLEAVIASRDSVDLTFEGTEQRLACATPAEKQAAFEAIYWSLRRLDSEDLLRAGINGLAARYGIDTSAQCRELCMDWTEIAALAKDPLVTIGCHTVSHAMLRKATAEVAREEMRASAAEIERRLGVFPAHLSYPVGDATSAGPREFAAARALGFRTAVTTRPGVLFPDHANHMTALPRISLNGEFQRLRYVKVLTSGAATAVWNGFRRVNAA